ncbi:hypothetical protein D3C81_1975820 [compost metagenome]
MHHHFAAYAGFGMLVAQHRALDLAAVDGRFHQRLVVVGQRQREGLVERLRVAHLADPDRGALVGRLDEQR